MKTALQWGIEMDKACVDTRSPVWTAEWVQRIQQDALQNPDVEPEARLEERKLTLGEL